MRNRQTLCIYTLRYFIYINKSYYWFRAMDVAIKVLGKVLTFLEEGLHCILWYSILGFDNSTPMRRVTWVTYAYAL